MQTQPKNRGSKPERGQCQKGHTERKATRLHDQKKVGESNLYQAKTILSVYPLPSCCPRITGPDNSEDLFVKGSIRKTEDTQPREIRWLGGCVSVLAEHHVTWPAHSTRANGGPGVTEVAEV